jgi:DNA ligase D-like protein (predicted 3'-phosphoesterase)
MKNLDRLKKYKEKRNFNKTSEPKGNQQFRSVKNKIYVIQKHDASNLHYDLRLESEGILKSWVLPKGPSMDSSVKRLAIPTENHPIEYATFEGVIPDGQYGAGTVILWDKGYYKSTKENESFEKSLEKGHSTLNISGNKLRGDFALIRTGKDENARWLFFKMKGKEARPGSNITKEHPNSVKTGKSLEEVRKESLDINDFS